MQGLSENVKREKVSLGRGWEEQKAASIEPVRGEKT